MDGLEHVLSVQLALDGFTGSSLDRLTFPAGNKLSRLEWHLHTVPALDGWKRLGGFIAIADVVLHIATQGVMGWNWAIHGDAINWVLV